MNTFIADIIANAVKRQGNLYRFKDSITLGLVAVVWIAAFVVTYLTDIPESAAVVVGSVGNFAALLVTRLTPGAITPSMAERLEAEMKEREEVKGGKHSRNGSWLDQAREDMARS